MLRRCRDGHLNSWRRMTHCTAGPVEPRTHRGKGKKKKKNRSLCICRMGRKDENPDMELKLKVKSERAEVSVLARTA